MSLRVQPPQRPAVLDGTIANPDPDNLTVLLDSFDGDLQVRQDHDAVFTPRGHLLPARGDRCVVVRSESGELTVVWFDGGTPADPSTDARFPSVAEKAALAGTSGTPADGNRYVTDSDSRLKHARGVATATWSGSSDVSGTVTVAHGLGAIPTGVLLTAQGQAGTGFTFAWLDTKDRTNLAFRAASPGGFRPSVGTTQVYAWEAFV